jgi:probable phosphoglycerate mutase
VSGPIYVARHGQTEFNRLDRLQGRSDSPLTELGVAQAGQVGRMVGRLLASGGGRPWVVWTSPQGRAAATARIIAEAAGLEAPPRIDERLAEIGGGSYEGLTRAEVAARTPGGSIHGVLLLRAPDGEPFAEVAARLNDWLDEVRRGPPAIHLAVSHGGAGRVLRGLWLGLDQPALEALPVPQDALFRLVEGAEERIDCL